MNAWLVLTVNSVTFGGLLFLLSAGFSLIFGLMRIPNLTHGSLFMMPERPIQQNTVIFIIDPSRP